MNPKNTRKLVSVIIPTFNAAIFIERCINTVLNQNYNNIEIIVIDDGSTDETVKLLSIFGNQITILKNDINQGPAYNRTKGLFICKGDYVAFLDADDYWEPDFVSATVKFLENNIEAVAVSTAYIGIDLKGDTVQKPLLTVQDKAFYQNAGNICPDFFEFWSRYLGVLTGTVMMRTDIARETQGQRKELRLTEDLEFWGYLSTFGKWGFIPRPLFITDPGVVPPSQRLAKMKTRYEFFSDLDIKEWSKRIDSNMSNTDSNSYYKIKNHIRTTIAIANAYTLNYKKSYQLVSHWKHDLEKGIGGVLRIGHSLGRITWPLVCLVLKTREFLKSYISYYLREIKKTDLSKRDSQ